VSPGDWGRGAVFCYQWVEQLKRPGRDEGLSGSRRARRDQTVRALSRAGAVQLCRQPGLELYLRAAPADAQSHLGLLRRPGLLVSVFVQMAPASAEAPEFFTTGAGSLACPHAGLSGADVRGGKDDELAEVYFGVFTAAASIFVPADLCGRSKPTRLRKDDRRSARPQPSPFPYSLSHSHTFSTRVHTFTPTRILGAIPREGALSRVATRAMQARSVGCASTAACAGTCSSHDSMMCAGTRSALCWHRSRAGRGCGPCQHARRPGTCLCCLCWHAHQSHSRYFHCPSLVVVP
jgi:hypothetical protein